MRPEREGAPTARRTGSEEQLSRFLLFSDTWTTDSHGCPAAHLSVVLFSVRGASCRAAPRDRCAGEDTRPLQTSQDVLENFRGSPVYPRANPSAPRTPQCVLGCPRVFSVCPRGLSEQPSVPCCMLECSQSFSRALRCPRGFPACPLAHRTSQCTLGHTRLSHWNMGILSGCALLFLGHGVCGHLTATEASSLPAQPPLFSPGACPQTPTQQLSLAAAPFVLPLPQAPWHQNDTCSSKDAFYSSQSRS